MSDTAVPTSGSGDLRPDDSEQDLPIGEPFAVSVVKISESEADPASTAIYTMNDDLPLRYRQDYHFVVGRIEDDGLYHYWNIDWVTNDQYDWDYALKNRAGFKHSCAIHRYHHHETDELVQVGTEVRMRMDNHYWYKQRDRVKRESKWQDSKVRAMRLELLSGLRSLFYIQDVDTGEYIETMLNPGWAVTWGHNGKAVFAAHTLT